MLKVKEITQTCLACPSQWEGILESGDYIYIRYRWGWFRAGYAKSEKEFWKNNGKYNLFEIKQGGDLEGWMDYEEMVKWSKNYLDFSECKIINKE